MTQKSDLPEDLISIQRRAEELRAQALAEGLRRVAGWLRGLRGRAAAPRHGKTA